MVVKVYNDRSFEFITKSPPAAALLKQAAAVAKGSGVPNKEKVGKLRAQIDDIVKMKWADLNASDVERARPDGRRDGPEYGDRGVEGGAGQGPGIRLFGI